MKKYFQNRLVLLSAFFTVVIAGCAAVPPVTDLPSDYQLNQVGSLGKGDAVAWHPDGERFSATGKRLVVGSVDGNLVTIDGDDPAAIAWSPTGAVLAASFIDGTETTVRLYDVDTWNKIAEIAVEGRARDLAFIDDTALLIASVLLKEYSFGANYTVRLYTWRQNEPLAYDTIADTSPLKSFLEALGDSIYDSVHLQISPFRDEILYTKLLLTPNAGRKAQLVVRHLATGRERIVAALPATSSGGRYLAKGDAIFFSDGAYQSIKGSIWGTEPYETYLPGLRLEISPGGRYKLIDNALLKDREEILKFKVLDSAAFSPDGSKLLLLADGTLFLLSFFDDAVVDRPSATPKLLELRSWRSEGLISPQEFLRYQRQLENR